MITVKAQAVLQRMLAAEALDDYENAELVCEGKQVYVGSYKVPYATFMELLYYTLIRQESEMGSVMERYTLNEDGRKACDDRTYINPALKDKLNERL